jgi:hypothetical protein
MGQRRDRLFLSSGKLHLSGTLRVAAIHMTTAQIIQIGRVTVGLLVPHPDSTRLTFQSTDQRFVTLDGSKFANRHAAQRAVNRIAATQDVSV